MDAKQRLVEMMESAKKQAEMLVTDLRAAKARLGAFQDSVSAIGSKGADSAALVVARRLQAKAEKESAAVVELEAQIVDANGRVSAFEEAIKLFPRNGDEGDLRPGSQMSRVRDALRLAEKPLTVTEILVAIGVAVDDRKKNSLRGSLAAYAREGRVFSRAPAPDTFGLIEFASDETSAGAGANTKGDDRPT
jgi:hypothetical protein